MSLENFIKSVYKTACNISDVKIEGIELPLYEVGLSKCEDNKKVFDVIDNLKLFVKKGLLTKDGEYFYLFSGTKRLTWKNIKSISNKDLSDIPKETLEDIRSIFKETSNENHIKSLFWLLRKGIIDNILLNSIIKPVTYASVGSTKVTSDYDITLDGESDITSKIVTKFADEFYKIFNESSDVTFDTNVYGVSFISQNKDVDYTNEAVCGDKFYYISEDNDYDIAVSQHIWAYIKLLLEMKSLQHFNEESYDLFYSNLKVSLEGNMYLKSAEKFINKYNSNIKSYDKISSSFKTFFDNNLQQNTRKYLKTNFTSFVNYNGSETYLTNGAFLDVVVNTQKCSSKNIVSLTIHEYIDSFVENMAYSISHYYKDKYIKRAIKASEYILAYFKNDSLTSSINKLFSECLAIQNSCSTDIIKCQSFLIIDKLFKIIFYISNYFYNQDNNDTKIKNSCIKFNKLIFISDVRSPAFSTTF